MRFCHSGLAKDKQQKTISWIVITNCDIKSSPRAIFQLANKDTLAFSRSVTQGMASSINCPFCHNEVPAPSQACPHCGRPGNFWNVIAANEPEERAALERRYQAAKKDAISRNVEAELQAFENSMADSKVVITRYYSEVLRLVSSPRQLYGTYYQLREAGLRLPDGGEWDMARQLADTLLFPDYKQDIRFAALTLDGRGLVNYGDCSIVLREKMIADRTSVFEENSALFVERHDIRASRKPNVPKGYRAIWSERARLAVAKLYDRIDSTTTPDKYSQVLLKPGATSEGDEFIEVHIYGSMTVLTMERVNIIVPQTSKRATIIRAIKSKLAKHNVQVD